MGISMSKGNDDQYRLHITVHVAIWSQTESECENAVNFCGLQVGCSCLGKFLSSSIHFTKAAFRTLEGFPHCTNLHKLFRNIAFLISNCTILTEV